MSIACTVRRGLRPACTTGEAPCAGAGVAVCAAAADGSNAAAPSARLESANCRRAGPINSSFAIGSSFVSHSTLHQRVDAAAGDQSDLLERGIALGGGVLRHA